MQAFAHHLAQNDLPEPSSRGRQVEAERLKGKRTPRARTVTQSKDAMLPTLIFLPTLARATSSSVIDEAAASFRANGYAVLPGFANADEVSSMRETMAKMVNDWWRDERETADNVFVTGDNQTKAQATSRYFFDSADRVHFFREPEPEGGGAADGPPVLNKVGHGLHLDASTPFGAYAQSSRISEVARAVAGLRAPVLPQSMYIFKAAKVGGVVTSHQDGTFLYTRPQQTVVGLWLALHDAHEGNGCLWARPGSHREPLRRRFVRNASAAGEVVMTFVDANGSQPESFLAAELTGGGPQAKAEAGDKTRWWVKLWRWLARRLPRGRPRTPWPPTKRVLRQTEAARAWEGSWPPSERAVNASELTGRGFVPLNVRAGDLVVFPGTLGTVSPMNAPPVTRLACLLARATPLTTRLLPRASPCDRPPLSAQHVAGGSPHFPAAHDRRARRGRGVGRRELAAVPAGKPLPEIVEREWRGARASQSAARSGAPTHDRQTSR